LASKQKSRELSEALADLCSMVKLLADCWAEPNLRLAEPNLDFAKRRSNCWPLQIETA
jgi:hypothetical protein